MQQPLTAPMPIYNSSLTTLAQVAELVDALASGASVCMDVEVRVLSWAPIQKSKRRQPLRDCSLVRRLEIHP